MSRIGKRPVALPKGVTVSTGADWFEVKGPKGTVRRTLLPGIDITVKGTDALVTPKADASVVEASRSTGTMRSHLNNAVTGVSAGFGRNLKLEGTGYRAELKGSSLTLALGLSHPVVFEVPGALSVKIPPESKGTVLQLETVDKDLLGQVVAKLQGFRPPEPYKGKGVRLVRLGKTGLLPDDMEKIRQKAGKAGKGSK